MKKTTEKTTAWVAPYTTTQLAAYYVVSPAVMRKRIDPFRSELGKRSGHYFKIPQVEIIFKTDCAL